MASAYSPNGASIPRLRSAAMPDMAGLMSMQMVGSRPSTEGKGFVLPLNLIAMIVSHLDELGDLARLTRTSRVLHYMTLPQLYAKVLLRSYPDVRRVNGRIQGLGGGSPICMALSGLSSNQHASLVRHFELEGRWKEDLDEYRQGRIPDSTMLLSIVVKNALDKMPNLQSFRWELDTKILRPIYQGLTSRTNLSTLIIRFPRTRTPRPVMTMPPMPNLRVFKVFDLDPLCHNDDISLLLLKSRKLEELYMHWNPRMRLEAEACAGMITYFGKCVQAGYKMKLRKLTVQNYYGPSDDNFLQATDAACLTEGHFFDNFGGAKGAQTNAFVDATWYQDQQYKKEGLHWRIHRTNDLAMYHVEMLRSFTGMKECYLVGVNLADDEGPGLQTPGKSPSWLPGADMTNLGNEYLDALCKNHGKSLEKLLLSNRFLMDNKQVAELTRHCPNLAQLGLALADTVDWTTLEIPMVTTLRVLETDFMPALEEHVNIARQLYEKTQGRLKFLGMGQYCYEIRKGDDDTTDVFEINYDDNKHIEVFGMDCLGEA